MCGTACMLIARPKNTLNHRSELQYQFLPNKCMGTLNPPLSLQRNSNPPHSLIFSGHMTTTCRPSRQLYKLKVLTDRLRVVVAVCPENLAPAEITLYSSAPRSRRPSMAIKSAISRCLTAACRARS